MYNGMIPYYPNVKYFGPILLRYSPDIENSSRNVECSAAGEVDDRVFHVGQLGGQICMDDGEKPTRAQRYKHHRPIGAADRQS